MKKLKWFYRANRIFVILMGISILCLALIAGSVVFYFLSQNNKSVYGNRLNGVDTVKIADAKLKEIKEVIEENEYVEKASLRIKGKIVYINIYLKEAKLTDGKNLAIKSLDLLDEEQKNVYDFSFALDIVGEREGTVFPIMGSKKSDNTIISWTNNNE